MAAADGGLFDRTDDEEEFLGFREEDIPVSVDENDKDLSGDSRGFNSSRVAGRSTGWQSVNSNGGEKAIVVCIFHASVKTKEVLRLGS